MEAHAENSARRWSGYVCPDCRFVFRVPRDHDGRGVVCPSCRRLLKLPAPGEVLPPLVVEVSGQENDPPAGKEVGADGGSLFSRRRKSGKDPAEAHLWESAGRRHRRGADWKLITVVVLILLSAAGTLVIMLRPDQVPTGSETTYTVPDGPAPGATPPPPTPRTGTEPPAAAEFLKDVRPLVTTFLEARTIPEILPVIRHPAVSEPRIRRRWPDGAVTPPGFREFIEETGIVFEKETAAVGLRTSDFKERTIYFARTADGWKIDWESWEGWSDLAWDEMTGRAPGVPFKVRAVVSDVAYYNFSFTDESKWRSFKLSSPDGEHHLFGYVERGSDTDRLINLKDFPGGRPMLLELQTAANAGPRQVLIHHVTAPGWIEPEPQEKR